MTRTLPILVATACLLALSISTPRAQQPEKPTCAVLTFDARAGVSTPEAQMLSDRFATEFDRLGRYTIVARSRMREVLEEQQFQATDHCSAAACAVEAGQLLGVRYMVYGTIGQLGQLYSINSFMVDVETGAQIRSATSDLRGGIEEALTELMARNASELLGLKPPAASTQAYFNILLTPNHARLILNNREIRPGLVPVEPNRNHTIAATLSGYHPYSLQRRVTPGVTESIDIRLSRHEKESTTRREERPRKMRTVYVSPRIGGSMATGLAGLEIQYKHFALSAGAIPHGPAGGVRWYFRQDRSSWFLGVCGLHLERDDSYGRWTDVETETMVGLIAGYRWRSLRGWEFTLGSGIGALEREIRYTRTTRRRFGRRWIWTYHEETDTESEVIPTFELAFGYAF